MTTYYRNDAGRIVVSSPWQHVDYWQRTREFNPRDSHEVNLPAVAEELTA
jgi:4-hydroxyacetophenone monooxygenase